MSVTLNTCLESVVCEAVEVGGREEIEGILGRHGHIAIVDITEQTVEGLPRRYHLPNGDLSMSKNFDVETYKRSTQFQTC